MILDFEKQKVAHIYKEFVNIIANAQVKLFRFINVLILNIFKKN